MSRPRIALLAVALAALSLARPAHADSPPGSYARLAHGDRAKAWDLHVRVVRLIYGSLSSPSGAFRGVDEQRFERARALLEHDRRLVASHAELSFDLGEVYQRLDRHALSIATLRDAVARFPRHPGVVDALQTLALSHAKLGQYKGEREVYLRLLTYVTDERARASVMLNLAESEMHLGNLDHAVARYREAFRLASGAFVAPTESETAALAAWGLAVALDRTGDIHASRVQAKWALRLDPSARIIGQSPNVFFVPAHERHYYLYLAARARADEANSVSHRIAALSEASQSLSRYLASAKKGDLYAGTAAKRQITIRRELETEQALPRKTP